MYFIKAGPLADYRFILPGAKTPGLNSLYLSAVYS